ncbi:MAG: hypothetical protein AAF222_00445 [Pseudomonadota bacterium]
MNRYFVSPTAEPADLHDSAEPRFAVHLAPDTRTQANAEDARGMVAGFVEKAPKARFYISRLTGAGTFGAPQELTQPLARPDAAFDLMDWLDSRVPVAKGETDTAPARYWLNRDTQAPLNEEGDGGRDAVIELTDASVIAAMDLLRGSLNWPAPLPQGAGLVHLIESTGLDPLTDPHVIFPWWDEADPTAPAGVWYGATGAAQGIPANPAPDTLDDAILLTVGGFQIITRFLRPFQKITGYQEDGWITPGIANTATVTQMRRARTAFGAALAPFPALAEFEFPLPEATPGTAGPDEAAYAKWADTAGTALLLDSLDVALFRPGRDGRLWDTLIETAAEVALAAELELADLSALTLTKSAFQAGDLKDTVDMPAEAEIISSSDKLALTEPEPGALEKALVEINQLSAELAEPGKLLNVTTAYIAACLDGWDKLLADPDNVDPVARMAFARDVEAAFRAYFTGPGPDLAADLRADMADLLMDRLRGAFDAATGPDRVDEALTAMDWPRARFTLTATGANDPLRPLAAPPADVLDLLLGDATPPGHIKTYQSRIFTQITSAEFTPDFEPQPLNIVASDSFDPDDLETITEQTTGLGLIISARHPSTGASTDLDRAAHANAAALEVLQGGAPATLDPVIEPSTLAANFGQVEISLPFNGVPQIGRLVARAADDDAAAAAMELPLPYQLTHATYGADFRALPPLAYGYAYHALPFYVSNYGILPEGISDPADRTRPISPTGLTVTDPAGDLYLRTTAVSQVPLFNSGGAHQGMGYVPQDVTPIIPDLLAGRGLLPGTDSVEPRKETDTNREEPPILLLGHKGKDWIDGLQGPAKLGFSVPRVSFEDFDRWVANPRLAAELADASDKSAATMDQIVERIEDARDFLEDARDRLADLGASNFAEMINRLADPAVRQLEVRVQVFDALTRTPTPIDERRVLDVAPYRALDLAALPDQLEAYVGFLSAIEANLQYRLDLKSDASAEVAQVGVSADGKRVAITLRPGDMCLVTIAPLVKQAHYDAGDDAAELRAMHGGLTPKGADTTLETEAGTMHRLPPAPLLVEAMDVPDDAFIVPASDLGSDPAVLKAFEVDAKGADRGFAYKLAPTFGAPGDPQAIFRAFAEVDLITHRWRSLGHPIYNWIAPAGDDGINSDGPVREVRFSDAVARFEGDAFFGRDLFDGERRRIRLPTFREDDRGNALELDRVHWPDQSACYWRYAQVFRSRYIGALRGREGEIPLIGTSAEPGTFGTAHLFADRVAVLADISGNTIAPPQLRHVLPSLATAPGHTGPLPYVASLNERPFDQFGLADRLVAGVTGTQTFALTTIEEKEEGKKVKQRKLTFETFRKEVGPEPRRALDGLDDVASRRVTLRTEGPVGHHFDPDAAEAPGFVNSSYLLHLDGTEPTRDVPEMFAQIEMRRLVDPGWSFARPRPDVALLPAVWALDLTDKDLNIPDRTALVLLHKPTSDAPNGAGRLAAVTLEAVGDEVILRVHKDAAYADPAKPGADPAELCRVNLRDTKVHLVLRSLGEDGYEVLILSQAPAPGAEKTGVSAPQLVASSVYKAGPLDDVQLQDGGASQLSLIKPILMGGAPGTMWVKSAYDMTRFCVGDALADLSGVRARLDRTTLRFQTPTGDKLRLTSRDVFAAGALGVHTHLAALTLGRAPSAGRTVLLPGKTVLLDPTGTGQLAGTGKTTGVALMAFESPAEVLTLGSGNAAPAATFDLDAVDAARDPQTDILLRLRVAELTVNGEDGLTLRLASRGWNMQAPPIVTIPADQLDVLSYIDIRVPVGGGPVQTTLYTHDPEGEGVPLEAGNMPQVAGLTGHLTLSLSGKVTATLDASMIPALPRDSDAWNWDWVFPPVAGDPDGTAPPALDTAIRPDHLRNQIEAVFAPLGISDPIKIAD